MPIITYLLPRLHRFIAKFIFHRFVQKSYEFNFMIICTWAYMGFPLEIEQCWDKVGFYMCGMLGYNVEVEITSHTSHANFK
jgi:hypothetical protein